jgi:hypothetical protein
MTDVRHTTTAIRFAGRASYGLLGSFSIAVIERARSIQAGHPDRGLPRPPRPVTISKS